MADFAPAVEKTLAHEGGYVHFPATGEYSNFGISHWFLREVYREKQNGFPVPRSFPAGEGEIERIKDMTRDAATELYRVHFWNKNRCGEITDQPLAEKLFDLSVNMGCGQAAKLLQRAVNVFTWPELHVTEDGAIGPKTIAAVNSVGVKPVTKDNLGEPHSLLDQLKAEAESFYRNLAATKPVLASNLAGWLKCVES